jgi:uncharacterized membrane protein YfcA
MSQGKLILLLLMGAFGVVFTAVWLMRERELRRASPGTPATNPFLLGVGFLTNFFDTLGIGSFATSTSIFRLRKTIDDRLIPGTLNVGHTWPTLAQAFIFITVVEVEIGTLVLMIVSSVVGAWVGAGLVAGLSRRAIRIGMGVVLFAAAGLMLMQALGVVPPGGEALALNGGLLVIGIVGNFILGALMTLGIGLYGPCMVLVSLLGMNPRAAFPIMMGSCAFLMSVAGARFVRRGSYDPPASLGLALGGVPAVLIAVNIVWKLPLNHVRWLVVAVVVYTAFTLLRAGLAEKTGAAATTDSSPSGG